VKKPWVATALALVTAGCGGTALVGGRGGSPGLGGNPGSGGGNGGLDGGTSGAAGASCDQLAAAYAATLNAARACTPGALGQCQAIAALSSTSCPEYPTDWEYVNDTTQVKPALQSWRAAACPPDPNLESECPDDLDPMLAAPPSICLPTSPGATTGRCTAYGTDAAAGIAPDGGESCDQLAADYVAALNAGRACNPGSAHECSVFAADVPRCDGTCPTWVAALDEDPSEAWSRWASQCQLACADPPSCGTGIIRTGTCVPVDGGSPTGGICVVTTPGSGDAGVVTDCDQLASAYAAALNAALACTPGAPNQCQAIARPDPHNCPASGCDNQQYVNDASQVQSLRMKWLKPCDDPGDLECRGSLCKPPPPSACVATSPGATTGTCMPVPSDAGASADAGAAP
jgi:hypothetical protein